MKQGKNLYTSLSNLFNQIELLEATVEEADQHRDTRQNALRRAAPVLTLAGEKTMLSTDLFAQTARPHIEDAHLLMSSRSHDFVNLRNPDTLEQLLQFFTENHRQPVQRWKTFMRIIVDLNFHKNPEFNQVFAAIWKFAPGTFQNRLSTLRNWAHYLYRTGKITRPSEILTRAQIRAGNLDYHDLFAFCINQHSLGYAFGTMSRVYYDLSFWIKFLHPQKANAPGKDQWDQNRKALMKLFWAPSEQTATLSMSQMKILFQFLESIASTPQEHQRVQIYKTAYYFALRCAEVRTLRRANVMLNHDKIDNKLILREITLFIEGSKTAVHRHHNHTHTVPVLPYKNCPAKRLCKILKSHNNAYLFPQNDHVISEKVLRTGFKKDIAAFKAHMVSLGHLEFEHLTFKFHMFRASAILRGVELNLRTEIIQATSRHADIKSHIHYVNASQRQMNIAYANSIANFEMHGKVNQNPDPNLFSTSKPWAV